MLVVATPLVALASARSLQSLAIAKAALQAIPLAQRLEGLRAATGRLITPIRKRYGTPLVPTLDLATVDGSGLAGGATWSWDGGPASVVTDYLVTFTVAGPVTSYTLTTHAGAYGVSAGPAVTLPPSQAITVDGYTVTFTGTIADGDTFAWSTCLVQDPGIAVAVAQVCAFFLFVNRGVGKENYADLRQGYEDAMAWAEALGVPGTGELDASTDRTPQVSEYGPLGSGQSSPYAFIDDPTRVPYA